MKKTAAIAFLLIGYFGLFAQLHPYNKAFIWRGFQHQWTYNHRCNRVGDYVEYNSGTPIAVHASATGIGPDSTYYSSYYTYVESPDVVFKEGTENIKIHAKEKQLIEKIVTVSVPADDWLSGKTDYVTLLNGFDLRSDEAADKIQLLRLAVEDGEYEDATNQIQFKIYVSLVLNCQSVECPETNNSVVYDLDIHYLLVGLNKGEAAATQQYFTRSYSWDKKEELNTQPENKVMTGDVFPVFGKGTVGIKSFSFVLNSAHWLLAMNSNVTPLSYGPATADMKLSVDLLFKEWQEGMRNSGAAPGKSKFAEKRKGWAVMDMDAVLLQFRTAKINYGSTSGSMFWHGDNTPGNGDKAKVIYDIPID
ncbi:MAG TPA: hypothetical protein VG603_02860 [Chitinophagales bacterium]|nr:hypothetical protein [Chitinophagales bacterium]